MTRMSEADAHNDIGRLWETAAKEPVTVESEGRPIAIVLSPDAYNQLTMRTRPREAGCARHLLSGAGIDVNELLSTSLDEAFSDYMPDR